MGETEPLLRLCSNELVIDDPQEEENAYDDVAFNSDGDPDNPMNWPNSYRWGVITLLASMAFTVYSLSLNLSIKLLIFDPAHSLASESFQLLEESSSI